MQSINIYFPPLEKIINKRFIELWENKDRYLILYGSRGSSKSDFVAILLVYRMLNDFYFKGISVRLTYESIAESTFKTMVEVIERFKLFSYFKINKSPFKIECINGNCMLFRGLDKAEKLKSINNPNLIHWEEDIIDNETDWTTISTTLRSNKSEFIQEIFTINPVIQDYESNWFYQMFFSNETELNFRKKLEYVDENGKIHRQFATVHHSSWKDNRWLTEDFITKIQLLAKQNSYLYQVYNLGIWCNKKIEGRFISKFDITKHISYKEYDSSKPLHISQDFNRLPYSAMTIYQIYGKTIYCIDEVCVMNRDIIASPTKQACIRFKEKYPEHKEGIYIYGDPTGRQEDSKSEKGFNDYRIMTDELSNYYPELRVANVAPSVKKSGEFINDIFQNNFNGLELYINNNCKELIKDLQYAKIDKEGGKLIEKVKTSDGALIEKYHHCIDTLRYFIVSYFEVDFSIFKNPIINNIKNTTILNSGTRKSMNKYNW